MSPLRTLLAYIAAIVSIAVLPARFANAGFTSADIAEASRPVELGAQLPDGVQFTDANGQRASLGTWRHDRPSLLMLADFECRTLCGTVAGALANAVENTRLVLGRDFEVIFVNLRANGTHAASAAFRDRHASGTDVQARGHFLSGNARAIDAIEGALGIRTPYDAQHDEFAHAASVIVVSRTGHVRATLDPLELAPTEIAAALTDGRSTAVARAVRAILVCVGFGGASGPYSAEIIFGLRIFGFLAVLLLAIAVVYLVWRERRAHSARSTQ